MIINFNKFNKFYLSASEISEISEISENVSTFCGFYSNSSTVICMIIKLIQIFFQSTTDSQLTVKNHRLQDQSHSTHLEKKVGVFTVIIS